MNIQEKKEMFATLLRDDFLNEKGMRYYISLLKGEIKDYQPRINATNLKETKADLKDAEKVRLASKREVTKE